MNKICKKYIVTTLHIETNVYITTRYYWHHKMHIVKPNVSSVVVEIKCKKFERFPIACL